MQRTTLAALALAFVATPALAQDKAACLDAAERGQRLRATHKLVEAQSALRVCASEQCPVVLRADCAGWLTDVEKALPTIVVAAKDAAGADLVDVAVTVDGQPFVQKLDGTSVPLDGGAHVFRFTSADGAAVERQVVVREGEKNQAVTVVLSPPAPPVVARVTPPAPPAPATDHGSLGGRIAGWTSVGVGVAAVGLGLGLYVAGVHRMDGADCGIGGDPKACRTDADTSAYDAGAMLQGAGIGLFVGAFVAVVGGAVLVLLSRSHAPADVARAPRAGGFAFSF
jgi:hypothetical protein